MSVTVNPFPAYPVAMLLPGSDDQDRMTVTTAEIERSERLIEAFLARSAGQRADGLNVAVKGEFGTGKTHLLTHAEDRLRAAAEDRGTTAGIVAVGAMEAEPVDWYRAMLGPRIGGLDLEGLATDLYARAATVVARRAPLTADAAIRLEEDPSSVRPLMNDELLSSSAVDGELIATVARIAPDTKGQVRAAIEGLISAPAPARRWFEGEQLSEREAVACGLAEPIGSDHEVADILVVLAAVHRELGRPFMLAIDELEHLVRLDESRGGASNLTWLKRLLERLQQEGSCVFVAGHTSAWSGHPDFLERFSPESTIELEPLTTADVVHIVERFAPGRSAFGDSEARLVTEFCDGNIRRTLGTLHALYERSNGLEAPVTQRMLAEIATASPRGLEPEQLLDDLGQALERDGLRVSRQAALRDLIFDLVAYRDGRPVVVVETKHALFGRKQQEQAQRFVDKLRVIDRDSPGCIGVFASSGAFDPALLAVDTGAARVFWFDLDRPDFVAAVEEAIGPVLHEPPPEDVGIAVSDRDSALAVVLDEIQAIKESQAADYARLENRLAAPDNDASDLQFRSPGTADTHDERRAIFEDLSANPPFLRQLALLRGPLPRLAALSGFIGLGLILVSILGESLFLETQQGDAVQAWVGIGGGILLLGAVLVGARQLLLLDRFFAFKRERLRDIYVLDLPIGLLIETSRTIDEALYGSSPQFALRLATDLLEDRGLIEQRVRRGGAEGPMDSAA